jgi:hypothetical protein
MRSNANFFPLLIVFAVSHAVIAQSLAGNTRKIADGTTVRVILREDLSSGTNHQNDPVRLEVAEDIKIGNSVLIAKGAQAKGHVSEAEPKGKWGHTGRLAYSVDYATAVDGSNVRLHAAFSQGGTDSKGAIMLGLSGALKKGKDISVPKGTIIDAYVDGDREVALLQEGSSSAQK